MNETGTSVPRRMWLLRALSAAVAITSAAIGYPVLWFLKPRTGPRPTGGLEVVAPYRVHELVADSDGNWPPPFDFGGTPCLLIRTVDGEVRAFNAICTHTDCTVKYRLQQGDIFCNCHNGVFDANGRNVSGPPPRPLETYKVTLRGQPGQEEIIVSRS